MRKKLLLPLLFICGFANAQNYTFTKLNQPYVELINGISINNNQIWDDFELSYTIPFVFKVNGIDFQQITINDSYVSFDGDLFQVISPLGNDLVDRGSNGETSLSPISYVIEGINGNRILKIQYKNCGSFDDESLTMYVNFQIWLFESTHVFEFHYGTSSVPDTDIFYGYETGGIIGTTSVDLNTDEYINSLFLTGDANNPTTVNDIDFVTGTPENTTVYRFTPTFLSTGSNLEMKNIAVFPNPSNSIFFVEGLKENQLFTITDALGKLIRKGMITIENPSLDLSLNESGLYFLNFESSNTIKLIKK